MFFITLVNIFIRLLTLGYAEEFAAFKYVGDILCPQDDRLFDHSPVKRIICLADCKRNAECHALNFHNDSQTCIHCDARSRVLNGRQENLPGWKFLEREIYGYGCTVDANCSEINGMCGNNVCTCARNKYYDRVERSCMPRFKLVPGNGGDGYKTGQLYMYTGVQWGNVCNDKIKWTWTATKAICQDINLTFRFGGTYHSNQIYGKGVASSPSTQLYGLDCGSNGSATSFFDCTTDMTQDNCTHDRDIGLTCYESDITDHIKLIGNKPGPRGQLRLSVMYGGAWGPVATTDWGTEETNVACRSIDPSMPNKLAQCRNGCAGGYPRYMVTRVRCRGDEPHLFFCSNNGWGKSMSHSMPDRAIGILCGP